MVYYALSDAPWLQWIVGYICFGAGVGSLQSIALPWRMERKLSWIVQWAGMTLVGWGLLGGVVGCMLVLLVHTLRAIMVNYDALFYYPEPGGIALLCGILGSSGLQGWLLRRTPELRRVWWRGSLRGWGVALVLFWGLGYFLPWSGAIKGWLAGAAAGMAVGWSTGQTLIHPKWRSLSEATAGAVNG